LKLLGPRDGSRLRPDGKTLKWKTLGMLSNLGAGVVDPIPFLIEWAADSIHPSQDSPSGCRLQRFRIEHPNPEQVVNVLKPLGIDVEVGRAPTIGLSATLATPKGEVVLR
jgi:Glyoxalase-like domain